MAPAITRSHRLSAPLLLALVSACAEAPPPVPAAPPPPPVSVVNAPPLMTPATIPPAAPPPLAAPQAPVLMTPQPAPPSLTVAGNCSYPPPPPRRVSGDLTVLSPPTAPTRVIPSRMRAHSEGALSHGTARTWVGRDVPPFVPLSVGTRELFLLDQDPDGFVGLYRDPYGASSCTLGDNANCSFGVGLFECSGKARWSFLLDPFFSRKDHLEVQDLRYAGGVLYFNEGCQTYSREAQGRCSSLVAVDPVAGKVLWRTRPLISNATFLVADRYLITGYGFTAEPDALYIVRRSDGKVMSRTPINSAHATLELSRDGVLTVSTHNDLLVRFRAEGFDGEKPRLVALPKGAVAPKDGSRLGF